MASIVLTEFLSKASKARSAHRPRPRRDPATVRADARRLMDYYVPLLEKGLASAEPREKAPTRAVLEALRDPATLDRELSLEQAAALQSALTRFSGGGLDTFAFLFHQAFTRSPAFALQVTFARGAVGVRDVDPERGYQSGVVLTEGTAEPWMIASDVWHLEELFLPPEGSVSPEVLAVALAAYEGARPEAREALAFVLRQGPWIDALAKAHVAAGRLHSYHAPRYLLELQEPATFESFVTAFPGAMRYRNHQLFVPRLRDFEPELWARVLAAVLEDTANTRPGRKWTSGDLEGLVRVAVCVDAPEIARWLAARAKSKRLAPLAADYLLRLPHHRALFDAAHAAAPRAKTSKTATSARRATRAE